jgi:hypothetical protein
LCGGHGATAPVAPPLNPALSIVNSSLISSAGNFASFLYIYIYIYILQRVHPLLCNDREMDRYTRAISGQRLRKHIPVARQQIINNARVGLQQSCLFYVVRTEML